jgi:hypothetical protein
MTARHRTLVPRDQATSAFSHALAQLCKDTGAVTAALVDAEGETVDYSGTIDPFETKVAAAEWRLVYSTLAQSTVPDWADTHELFVRAQTRSYALIALSEGYALVLELSRHCAKLSTRSLGRAVRAISAEAGLRVPRRFVGVECWHRVRVRPSADDPKRPAWLWHDAMWHEVTILGLYRDRDFRRHDRGYRARLANGAELFLVREPLGRWYAEGID